MPLAGSNAAERRFWFAAWGGAIGCLGVLDIWRLTKHDGTTLSEILRGTFHTETPEGRILFLIGLGIFARHILK